MAKSKDVVPIPAHLAVAIEPFTDDELDEAIDAIWRGEEPPAKIGSFEISDEGRAEWAMRKLVGFQGRVNEINRWHDDWAERIENDRQEQLRRVTARVTIFQTVLEQYGKLRRIADPKNNATTYLPSGTIKTTLGTKPTVHIDDDAKFAAWALTNIPEDQRGPVVKLIPKVYVMEFRKLLTRIGKRKGGPDDGAEIVEFAATEKGPWVEVKGVRVEQPEIKPSVHPDLSA